MLRSGTADELLPGARTNPRAKISKALFVDRSTVPNNRFARCPPNAATVSNVVLVPIPRARLAIGIVDVVQTCVAASAQRMERGGHTFGGEYRQILDTSTPPPAEASPTRLAKSRSPWSTVSRRSRSATYRKAISR